MDTGLLVLRLVIGGLLVGHGAQKLFGWFGGYGVRGTGGYLAGLGYRPGVLFALLAGMSEAAGGASLALGLGVPVGGALLAATMINVASGHKVDRFWNHEGGWEFPLVLGVAAVTLAFTGGGSYALDHALGWDLAGNAWGSAALIAGAIAGGAAQAIRRVQLRRLTAASTAA
jgi:putative oxidoreductase